MNKKYTEQELQSMTVEELQQISGDMDNKENLIKEIQELQNVTVKKPQIAKNQLQQSRGRTTPKPTLTTGQRPYSLVRGDDGGRTCAPGEEWCVCGGGFDGGDVCPWPQSTKGMRISKSQSTGFDVRI